MQNTRSSNANIPALWMLIVAQLDPQRIEYATRDIAPLVGIDTHRLRGYCRELWPRHADPINRYYLSFDEAAVLIYRVCRDGRKLPDLVKLHRRLLDAKIVTSCFPVDMPRIERASNAIISDREKRAALRRAYSMAPSPRPPRLSPSR